MSWQRQTQISQAFFLFRIREEIDENDGHNFRHLRVI
jgi:hypothetical protein